MNEGWVKDMSDIADADVRMLVKKEQEYGSSWKIRGGVGALMMLARKWDRLENQVKKYNYDVFAAIQADPSPMGILDDIGDLRRYLLLVEAEVLSWGKTFENGKINLGASRTEHPAPFGYDGEEK